MIKLSAFKLLMILVLFSCQPQTKEVSEPTSKGEAGIEGSWKLVYADIREKDTIMIKDLTKTAFIKILNKTHFAFFNQDHGTGENFMSGAGTYTFDGENYTETLDFIQVTELRGHVFPFRAEIKGDSLIQQGHEFAEEAGLDRYILEKYVRITN